MVTKIYAWVAVRGKECVQGFRASMVLFLSEALFNAPYLEGNQNFNHSEVVN